VLPFITKKADFLPLLAQSALAIEPEIFSKSRTQNSLDIFGLAPAI